MVSRNTVLKQQIQLPPTPELSWRGGYLALDNFSSRPQPFSAKFWPHGRMAEIKSLLVFYPSRSSRSSQIKTEMNWNQYIKRHKKQSNDQWRLLFEPADVLTFQTSAADLWMGIADKYVRSLFPQVLKQIVNLSC